MIGDKIFIEFNIDDFEPLVKYIYNLVVSEVEFTENDLEKERLLWEHLVLVNGADFLFKHFSNGKRKEDFHYESIFEIYCRTNFLFKLKEQRGLHISVMGPESFLVLTK